MKSKKCKIIFNTTYGYCMRPIECDSISSALRLAHETNMAFRLFDENGNKIKHGWYI